MIILGTYIHKGPVIRATFFFNLQCNIVALLHVSVVARITTHLKHCHATRFCCCKLKKFVEKSRRQFNLLQHAASTCNNKFCCMTMFQVGGNTCNNAFQLATQQCKLQQFVARITYNRALIVITYGSS